MYYYYPPSLERLIAALSRLPGIGPKTATRLAFFLLHGDAEPALGLADAIREARQKVRHCRICGNLTDEELCPVCQDPNRDEHLLCVVEQPRDVISIERTHEFHGRYHVLHGAISPMDGAGPEDLAIDSLMERLADGKVRELVMATNPTVEGEATAQYIKRLLEGRGIEITRLACGVPIGSDLEYADEATLARAFLGRKRL